ncbi:MAG: TrpB-like pyridoxal phosphate-dependent enzyme [Ignavibacteria bacterium]|jgi:tryptophan synthase beta chain|nr:TrpB-like pyridoxal phosphate-dependent enzyme [Ignavibacteria bacterium]MCU7503680.1 TrpB-like pyridoxal phosphate-dependent enzyme [Ignavibacteria bacterium]MCU7517673.1 TrpB-like pyridoxal phosphate-dependent enzyme [Ignavibacteria bacterium]
MKQNRIILDVKEMPKNYYNILADLGEPLAMPLNPATKQPASPQDLAAIFPMEIIEQEMTTERYIEIPDEVLDLYAISRPSPLIRAYQLEKFLKTPAKIFFKYEGSNPSGSHKTNTAIAQAYYNKKAGIKRLVTETGAGQWGSALSQACNHFGLECQVFMVKVSYHQKPYRKSFMQLFGADVVASPSTLTQSGRRILEQDPNSPGSLGIAISEAVELAVQRDDTNYSLGSVLNHVLLHQTIIGEEAKLQMEKAGEYPDVVIACVGGGSNFGGISFPFLKDKLTGEKKDLKVIAVEPASCPTLTKGEYLYDFGDEAGMTPMMKMYTLGHNYIPPSIHAGGLRYHGASPIISNLYNRGIIDAEAYQQNDVFEAARIFAQTEGIVPAPESSHAIKSAIEQARLCTESGEAKTILFNLSGHGFLDLGAYEAFLKGELEDYEAPDSVLSESIKQVPEVA